ncbi:uncharacterized protein LOC112598632 [Melanaphis sacchari]|uniref:uncharacterized protein LOC112598632 n=1 Tax=Melanaphis sacchari TaxID=742174 RepID=UPI000DC13266|nr:uncharacterized protein LOC112598632 [Melanaphis sacchari]
MNSAVVLVIVMLLASHVSSSPVINFSWDTPRHFCGSQLANVLALICSNGYNFHPASDDVTVPSRRRKRVIVEECCENTCTPKHLKSYCWENRRSDTRSVLELSASVEKPSVDKNVKPQKDPTSNTLSQSQSNSLLQAEYTTVKTKSYSIIPNSKELGRQNDIKTNKYNTVPYVPKKEAVIVQDPVPGRVKTVTPYFDKMPSVIVTKTTQY